MYLSNKDAYFTFTIFSFFSIFSIFSILTCQNIRKSCAGTITGNAKIHDNNNFDYYKKLWEGCSVINGNLELLNITAVNKTIDYFHNLIEIRGYLSVRHVNVVRINLPSLLAIRGYSLYSDTYAIFISRCGLKMTNKRMIISIPKLAYVGASVIKSKSMLGFWQHVDWETILKKHMDLDPLEKVVKLYRQVDAKTEEKKLSLNVDREVCVKDCIFCWGESQDDCYIRPNSSCFLACGNNCMPTGICCSDECLGECSGPTSSDCLLCKHVLLDNKCTSDCPPHYITRNGISLPNPKGVFYLLESYICKKECPTNMIAFKTNCVKYCPANTILDDVSRVCITCGDKCHTKCHGISDNDSMHYDQLLEMENCTFVRNNIIITTSGITLFSNGSTAISEDQVVQNLFTPLRSILHISGYVYIHLNLHAGKKSLSFLENVHTIDGNGSPPYGAAILIANCNLEQLGLKSLKNIGKGSVYILDNPQLCLAESVDWKHFFLNAIDFEPYIRVVRNRNEADCIEDNFVCNAECKSSFGCFGRDNDMCVACRKFKTPNGSCVNECKGSLNLYQDEKLSTCKICHSECAKGVGCSGSTSKDCVKCENFEYEKNCIKKCPTLTFFGKNGKLKKTCIKCDYRCSKGCLGPLNFVSLKGCIECHLPLIPHNVTKFNSLECLDPRLKQCPAGYIFTTSEITGKLQCSTCHPLCKTCDIYGCTSCKFAQLAIEETCVGDCLAGYYHEMINGMKYCHSCHHTCKKCQSGGEGACTECKEYRLVSTNDTKSYNHYNNTLYDDGVNDGKVSKGKLNCSMECLGKIISNETSTKVCVYLGYKIVQLGSNSLFDRRLFSILLPICIFLLIILVAVFCIVKFRKKRRLKQILSNEFNLEEKKLLKKIDSKKVSFQSKEANMRKLRVINQEEVVWGEEIGSGAYGTVYRCMWVPKGEGVKIPVAAKVLKNQNNGFDCFLDEIRLMIGLRHTNVLNILGVVMSNQPTIFSQLLPMGCLLTYLRRKRNNIHATILLNWCKEIALGMEYLEKMLVIHRDLAARNLLIHNDASLKITDFGLAKLTHLNNTNLEAVIDSVEEYHALPVFTKRMSSIFRRNNKNESNRLLSRGRDSYKVIKSGKNEKLPIRWLSPESLISGSFSHYSDVWSFGVTLWEIFTFGHVPYNEKHPSEIYKFLINGQRLAQPEICSVDVYLVLIRCWVLDPLSRPNFSFLAASFEEMSQTPQQYVLLAAGVDDGMGHVNNGLENYSHYKYDSESNCGADILEADEYEKLNEKKSMFRRTRSKRRTLDDSCRKGHSPLVELENALDDKIMRDRDQKISDRYAIFSELKPTSPLNKKSKSKSKSSIQNYYKRSLSDNDVFIRNNEKDVKFDQRKISLHSCDEDLSHESIYNVDHVGDERDSFAFLQHSLNLEKLRQMQSKKSSSSLNSNVDEEGYLIPGQNLKNESYDI